MHKFNVHDGNFWLDDQPAFIQAGEFHYFRTPSDQWRHRLGLLQAAGFNTLATYIPWLWHQVKENDVDFDGHSHPLRNLTGFLDLAAEMGFWIIARPGPYIMAETINEGIPPWVFSKYPQVACINQDRKAQNIASYLHPDFLACVSKWYRSVFSVLTPRQIKFGGRIIMIQLDNEMGMLQWVRNIFDLNPDTLSKFVTYLQDTYGESLSRRYQTEHLEQFIIAGLCADMFFHQAEQSTLISDCRVKIVEDYRRFYRIYLRDYASFLFSEAKANGMNVLPVINIHGFGNGGKTFPIGLSQLVAVMEMEGVISATDVYPLTIGEGNFHQLLLVNEMTKALQNDQQALFSIEFQAGGNNDFSNGQTSLYDLHSRLCISLGMRAINHYLFCDGENDPILSPVKRHDWGHPVRKDGTLRKHYFRYPKLSKVMQAYSTDLISSRPKTVTTIGFLLDYFMTEVNNKFSQESTNILTHQRDVILFDMLARGLSITHRPFNILELSRCELDVQKTPVCWVMIEKQCDAGTQQKLVEYVKQGGNLILVGRMCVEDFDHGTCTILKDAIGIEQIHTDSPFKSTYINAFQYRDVLVSFLETYSGKFSEVFATHQDGGIVGFIQNMGKGRFMMFGAAMAANTLDDLDIFDQMAARMACPPLFKLSNWADIRLSCGENGKFLFMNNYQDDPIETTVTCEGEMLFSGNPIRLPARRGLILPLDWKLKENVMIHYVTSEIIEVNDTDHTLVLKTEQCEFVAEMSLFGYHCDHSVTIYKDSKVERVKLHGNEGVIVLRYTHTLS